MPRITTIPIYFLFGYLFPYPLRQVRIQLRKIFHFYFFSDLIGSFTTIFLQCGSSFIESSVIFSFPPQMLLIGTTHTYCVCAAAARASLWPTRSSAVSSSRGSRRGSRPLPGPPSATPLTVEGVAQGSGPRVGHWMRVRVMVGVMISVTVGKARGSKQRGESNEN